MSEPENTFLPSLASDLYQYLISFSKLAEMLIFMLGSFLSFFGVKYKSLSQKLLFWLLTASILYRHKRQLLFITKPLELAIRNIVPAQYLELFVKTKSYLLGFTVLSLLSTSVILSLFAWARLITKGFLLHFIYFTFEPFFISNFKNEATILCLITSILCVIVLCYIEIYLIFLATGMAICFMGICIILMVLSYRISYLEHFQELYLDMVNLNPRILIDPEFFAIIGTTILLFFIQVSFFKL